MERRHTSRRGFLRRGISAAFGAAMAYPQANVLAQSGDSGRFEVSLHQYSVKKLIEDKQLGLLKYPGFAKDQFGITSVEFAAEYCAPLLDTPGLADEVRKASEAHGVKNRVLLCAASPALDGASAGERAEAVLSHVQWAKVAERLGCEFIRVRASGKGEPRNQLEYAAEGIGALCDKLKDAPIAVLIENIGEHSRNPAWLIELAGRIGAGRAGLLADFTNFEGDIYEGMAKLVPYSKSLCAKSWDFDAEGNETKIDFQRMMNVIKKSEYRGCIAIEYLGGDPIEGISKTAALIKRFS